MKSFLTFLLIVFTTTIYSQNIIQETNLGGTNHDLAYSIIQTIDGGYIIAGSSESYNGDVGGNNGGHGDYQIVKLDTNGILDQETNLGGSGSENATSITQTIDGGYIIAGFSGSDNGDVGGNNGPGHWDYWVVKLGNPLSIVDNIASKIILSPNPTTDMITISNLPQEITKIEALDIQGRVVLSKNNIINNTINISNLQPASYLIKIDVGRSIFYKKIIKK